MTDNKLIENLIKALQYEYRTYQGILKLAERKTECLVKNNTEELQTITEEEKQAAEQTFKLNQVREQIIVKICEETGLDYKTMTLDVLKQQMPAQYQKALIDAKDKLNEVVNKLIARNGINEKLIDNAVKYIDFNMQLISSPQPSVPQYGRTGNEVNNNTKRSILELKFYGIGG